MSSTAAPPTADPSSDDSALDLRSANWTPPFRETWRSDAAASVVVFLVALPLCLGVALASGAPLFSGIVTGIIGGIVVGALSGSQLMVSGPAAGLTAIVLTAITTLGSFSAFLVAIVLAGAMQIGLGVLRAGVIGYYFPNAVIRGMLGGIGIIIILKQIPHALGYDATPQGDQAFRQANDENTFSALISMFQNVETGAVLLSVVSMLILVLWDQKFMKRAAVVPGALVAVVLGVVANAYFTGIGSAMALGGDHMVTLPIITSLAEMRGAVDLPDWSTITSGAVWTVAFTVAVVASLETLLSLEATDRIDPLKREAPANRELMAQGVGNMLCGLLGGLPMTGVIVRSSANVYAGGKTKTSAILHGALLLLAVLLIPAILNRIPLAVLAAILIYTGWKLAHPRQLKYFLSKGFHQWLPFVATTAAILLTDLLKGIMVGLAVSVVFILLEHLRSPSYTLVPGDRGTTRIRLHEHLTFLSKANLTQLLQSFPKGADVEIDGSACKRIDHDVMEVMREFRAAAELRGVSVRTVGLDLGPTTQGLAH